MPKNRRNQTAHSSRGKEARRPLGRKDRRVQVRAVLRNQPDVGKLARAVVAMALAEAERDAQARRQRREQDGTGAGEVRDGEE